MGTLEVMIVSIGLAMDALAVSICKGLSMKKVQWKEMLVTAAYFGGFQAIMPLLGFMLGAGFHDKIIHIDHWLTFILLGTIGIDMLKEACSHEKNPVGDSMAPGVMLPLAVATSIDALAVGVTFAFLKVNISKSITIIGVTTCIIVAIGVKIGNEFGRRYEKRAQVVGGIILILQGLKILLEHLHVI